MSKRKPKKIKYDKISLTQITIEEVKGIQTNFYQYPEEIFEIIVFLTNNRKIQVLQNNFYILFMLMKVNNIQELLDKYDKSKEVRDSGISS